MQKDIIVPDFIQIPNQIFTDRELSSIDQLVYGLIYWYTKLKLEKCFASNDTFANILGVKPRKISESISKLSERGYIKAIYFDDKKRNRKEIIPLVVFSKIVQMDLRDSPEGPTLDSPNGPQNKNILEKNIEQEYSLPKVRNYNPKKFITWLDSIQDDFIRSMVLKYDISPSQIRSRAEDMKLYCGSTGKPYKDYSIALESWIKKDFPTRSDRSAYKL